MMLFNPKKTSFGRNETFGLRYGWLPKGYNAFRENKNIFTEQSACSELGLGKNMVQSMRYWLYAYSIMDQQKGELTSLADLIFDSKSGLDPYMEDIGTLWLLHWKLCTNPQQATLYYWFFNHFRSSVFTKSEVMSHLLEWLNEKTVTPKSANTLERDLSLLLRTYSIDEDDTKNIEEILENPFSELNLIIKGQESSYRSVFKSREGMDSRLMGFFLMDLINTKDKGEDQLDMLDGGKRDQTTSIPVGELIHPNLMKMPSIASIFRLDENTFYTLLENLTTLYPDCFDLREDAGVKQLYFLKKDLSEANFLHDYYAG
jgi:hypothetical protein